MPLFWTSCNVSSGCHIYLAEFLKNCKEIENNLVSVACSLDALWVRVDMRARYIFKLFIDRVSMSFFI